MQVWASPVASIYTGQGVVYVSKRIMLQSWLASI